MNAGSEELGVLEPAALLAAASQQAGLDDFGDTAFMEPFTLLMNAIVNEANLNQMGLLGTQQQVIQNLVNRLRIQDDLKKHPEILEEDVSDPIVIIGLPRTGTTKLQRMMSEDPAVQKCHLWKLLNPAPLPDAKPGEIDGRIALAQAGMDAIAQIQPDYLAGHPMAATEADEDVFMMEMSFEGILPVIKYRVPSYEAWMLKRSRQYFYSYQKLLFQYLQWQDGGARGRPWLLKAATHLGGFDELVRIYPKATFVHCHRDIASFLASCLRVGEVYRGLVTNTLDLNELGVDYVRLYSREMSSYLEQRKKLAPHLRIIDVNYKDIVADPMAVIRTIRAAHKLPVTPEGERAMLGWGENNPQYRHGKLTSSLEHFGLTREKAEAAFAAYRQQYAAWL